MPNRLFVIILEIIFNQLFEDLVVMDFLNRR